MLGSRRWRPSRFERQPESSFKLLAIVLVITLYLIIKESQHPFGHIPHFSHAVGARIQYHAWNGTDKAHEMRAKRVRDAMKYTFRRYRENAWGRDEIHPVSGGNSSSRNGWGAFVVDSASTLALMGLWNELSHAIEHILGIDFEVTTDLVDTHETTSRCLGGLLSIVDLYDAGLIPQAVLHEEARDLILEHAVTLAKKLAPAYETPTRMPWPRVNFQTEQGEPDTEFVFTGDSSTQQHGHPVIAPAQSAFSILESRVLTRLTGDSVFAQNATSAWAPLVWSKWKTPWAGMIDAPLDIVTGAPTGRVRTWDSDHTSYYENLLKITVLSPPTDPFLKIYQKRFQDAALSLRSHLATRSAPTANHLMQHLFIGRQDDDQYQNIQSHTACSVPGALLVASKHFAFRDLRTLAIALLDACHHAHASTPTGLAPSTWSWTPTFGRMGPSHKPQTPRQINEVADSGIWSIDPSSTLSPAYVESLFYAWRITADLRFRNWAWDAFKAMEEHCKAPFGYTRLADVYGGGKPVGGTEDDVQDGLWVSGTLKFLWLTFEDAGVGSLDYWVYSRAGHGFRISR